MPSAPSPSPARAAGTRRTPSSTRSASAPASTSWRSPPRTPRVSRNRCCPRCRWCSAPAAAARGTRSAVQRGDARPRRARRSSCTDRSRSKAPCAPSCASSGSTTRAPVASWPSEAVSVDAVDRASRCSRRARPRSSAARAAWAAIAARPAPRNVAPGARARTTSSRTRRRRTRRCSTGCPATATRSTPTRRSPPWAASTAPSCTACARTGSPAGRCCTRCAASDPARFKSMEARFSSPVYPGDELTIRMWETGDGEAVFQTRREGSTVVIDNGLCRYST